MSFEGFNKFVEENPDFQKKIVQMLQDAKKSLEDEKSRLCANTDKIAARLVEDIITKNLETVCDEIHLSIYMFRNIFYQKCLPRLAIVELLNLKLSQPQIELTENEQWVLVRLFLESKLCSPELMISELEQSMKKLELMFKAITLTLYRYYSVHRWCPDAIIRREVFLMRREDEIYERTISGSFFSFDVKSDKESDCDQIRKNAFDLAKIVCIEKYNMFCKRVSTFKFDKLMTDFERIILIFSEIFGNQPYLYGRTFNHELIDSRIMHELFLPLIKIESMFLDEKQNLDDFLSKSYELLKEISEMIEPISNCHHDYCVLEAAESGGSKEPKYQELFDEMKGLAKLLTACLKKECQDSCDCKRNFYGTGRRQPPPDEIVHNPVEITEDEMREAEKFVNLFSENVLRGA
jgi:hypothetical protein